MTNQKAGSNAQRRQGRRATDAVLSDKDEANESDMGSGEDYDHDDGGSRSFDGEGVLCDTSGQRRSSGGDSDERQGAESSLSETSGLGRWLEESQEPAQDEAPGYAAEEPAPVVERRKPAERRGLGFPPQGRRASDDRRRTPQPPRKRRSVPRPS